MAAKTITRAWRIRVYPTASQRRMLPRLFGACRWLKAHALDLRSSAYQHFKLKLTGTDISHMLTGWKRTPGHEWLQEVPSTCLTQALRDQDRAFTNSLPDAPNIRSGLAAATEKASAFRT